MTCRTGYKGLLLPLRNKKTNCCWFTVYDILTIHPEIWYCKKIHRMEKKENTTVEFLDGTYNTFTEFLLIPSFCIHKTHIYSFSGFFGPFLLGLFVKRRQNPKDTEWWHDDGGRKRYLPFVFNVNCSGVWYWTLTWDMYCLYQLTV